MLQIIRVDILDGQTLDVELNNGHLILFDTKRLPKENSSYDKLRDLELLPRPSTDGQSVYWRDGTRLALGEIMALLNKQDSNE
ncbi:hypothetical protein JR334_10155 [Clostridia bacterium]|nr:hypothetical protein JR334_10155 [Clostridia bacterium]